MRSERVKPFTIVNTPQRTAAWYAARLGRLTGSCAGAMLATVKSGEAVGRRNLRLRLVLERLTNRSQESEFVSAAMEAGIDREPAAFRAYEALTGDVAETTGFLAHRELMAGCSLDGHVGDFSVLLSIKCRQPAAHLECLRHDTIPSDAMAQMVHELWMTGASAHHYFSFNPDFPEAMQSRLIVIARDEAAIAGYDAKARAFLAEIDREVSALTPMAALREAANA